VGDGAGRDRIILDVIAAMSSAILPTEGTHLHRALTVKECKIIRSRQQSSTCYAVSVVNALMSSMYFRSVLAAWYDAVQTYEPVKEKESPPKNYYDNYYEGNAGNAPGIQQSDYTFEGHRGSGGGGGFQGWLRRLGIHALFKLRQTLRKARKRREKPLPEQEPEQEQKACEDPIPYLLELFAEALSHVRDAKIWSVEYDVKRGDFEWETVNGKFTLKSAEDPPMHADTLFAFVNAIVPTDNGRDGGHSWSTIVKLLGALEPKTAVLRYSIWDDERVALNNAVLIQLQRCFEWNGYCQDPIQTWQIRTFSIIPDNYIFDHIGVNVYGNWFDRSHDEGTTFAHAVTIVNLCGEWYLIDPSYNPPHLFEDVEPGHHPTLCEIVQHMKERYLTSGVNVHCVCISYAVLLREGATPSASQAIPRYQPPPDPAPTGLAEQRGGVGRVWRHAGTALHAAMCAVAMTAAVVLRPYGSS
jgi:hypothetical protein